VAVSYTAIAAFIGREYSLDVAEIVEGPRGWVGETFVVSGAGGERYFAKLFNAQNAFRAPDSSLLVLEQLRQHGIDNLVYPLRTIGGALSLMFGEMRLVLFEFIGGVSGLEGYDFLQYADIMARVHQASAPAMRDLPVEDFGLEFNEPLAVTMQRLWQSEGDTHAQVELRRFLGRYRAQIDAYWDELQALALSCRAANWTPVITHNDAIAHNLLVDQAGKVYIIDWDEMMLGPRERDNWFWLYGDEAADFLRVYRRYFPGYEPDAAMCRFFLLRRFFEDLSGFMVEIDKRPHEAEKLRTFSGIEDSWFDWLWMPMQMRGPRTG
jgi:Phosphotransferase enzyme family